MGKKLAAPLNTTRRRCDTISNHVPSRRQRLPYGMVQVRRHNVVQLTSPPIILTAFVDIAVGWLRKDLTAPLHCLTECTHTLSSTEAVPSLYTQCSNGCIVSEFWLAFQDYYHSTQNGFTLIATKAKRCPVCIARAPPEIVEVVCGRGSSLIDPQHVTVQPCCAAKAYMICN